MRRPQLGLRHVSAQSQVPAHRGCPFDKRISDIDRQHHAKKAFFGDMLSGTGQ